MTISGPAAAMARIAAIRSSAEALRPTSRTDSVLAAAGSNPSGTVGSVTSGTFGSVTPGTFGSVLATATAEANTETAPTSSVQVVNGAGYAELFAAAGDRHDIDPNLLAAVAQIESAFDPAAVSPAGAQGLMQFMPATAAEMGVDPFDPASAIDGAARYLRQQLDRFGTTELALAAYNAGPGAVSKFGGIPPYPETQNYVTKVLEAWEQRT